MITRRALCVLIAVIASAVAVAPLRAAALPVDEGAESMPVHGSLAPAGSFVGHLTIVGLTVDDDGHIFLTGVLNGTATNRAVGETPVTQHVFTAPAALLDSDRTTDVLLVKLAPIPLDPVGLPVTLEPVALDIYAVLDDGDTLWHLLYRDDRTGALPEGCLAHPELPAGPCVG